MHRLFSNNLRRFLAVFHDLLMVPVAWLGAYWLRFNLESIPQPYRGEALETLAFVLLVQAGAFWFFGLYRGLWRFASLPDLVRIGKAVLTGTLIIAMALFLATRLQGVPRSVFPLYAILLAFLTGGPRLLYRWYKDNRLTLGTGRRVLVVGAGRGGEMLVRDLVRNRTSEYQPIGFVDDDPKKQGKEIHGFRVFGPVRAIPEVVAAHDIELVIIAIPSAHSREMRAIVEVCETAEVPFRTLPGTQDIAAGRAVMQTLREVSIDDLLGREPVSLDWEGIRNGLSGRCVLVTGGGGSIGSELSRQVARLEPERLVLFEASEFNLYKTERELRERYPHLELEVYLGDVNDTRAVAYVMERYRPQVVFHAAAYKHVPLLEGLAREAIRNNVLGTRTVALEADRAGCETFVLISTDKAVNPTNVMGASKRAAEIFCQNLAQRSQTRFITVRFGNVLGSAGSVVPLFREQIARGGPVTVTHPEVTRFFMTIPEACQLIMQAGVIGRGGEIFVLDMGEPVKIQYLAEQMIRLTGKTPHEDVEIVYTGLRPGEKLYEELFHEKEPLTGTDHEKILLARYRQMNWPELENAMAAFERVAQTVDEPAALKLLGEFVPEFHPVGPEDAGRKVVQLEELRKGR